MNQENNEELSKLYLENEQLKEKCKGLDNAVKEIYGTLNSLIEMLKGNMNVIESYNTRMNNQLQYAIQIDAITRNIKYEVCDLVGCDCFFKPKMRSNEETLRLIIQEKKSLARFGDGEFSIAGNINRQKFQKINPRLAERIREVLKTDNEDIIVALADNYGNLERYNQQSADGIRFYMTEETRKLHESLLDKDKIYSDAYMTRPYVLYKDNLTDAPRKRFDELKKIWDRKKVIIVEGAETRLGVGNDLFANAESIRRIIAPPTNSYDKYDEILEASLEISDSADIFLLAIGPSAGVLAYDLTLHGIQAVDVGHIDMEYEWMLAGKGVRVPVHGKYNNEIEGGDVVEDIKDAVYDSQIVYNFAE